LKKAQLDREVARVGFGRDGPTITNHLFADDSIVFLEVSKSNLETLKRVLARYECCSGQWVNLQKSSIYFGKGCADADCAELKSVLGIDCEALSEKYLGLPMVVGRSKNGAFKSLIEHSRGKCGGWKGKGMSRKGKEILIKSVL
jgi:hypothetical protein